MVVKRMALFIWLCIYGMVVGQVYTTDRFSIHSELDERYIAVLQRNIEGYYDNMVSRFFEAGWSEPLSIYYFEKQSDTQQYLGDGHKVYYGLYDPKRNAIFTHRVMDAGGLAGLGTVFHEITHHFVRLNYNNPPTWFNEGLTCFLSEQSRLVKDYLNIGHPNLWREKALRQMIETGTEIDIRYYTGLSTTEFYAERKNYHPVRALFYWIYTIGKLDSYLQNAQLSGYDLDVLEDTVGLNWEQINEALMEFIQVYCYAGAYVQDSYFAESVEEKKAFLKTSLSLVPDYSRARLELGKLYFFNKDDDSCVEALMPLLNDNTSIEYKDANLYLAKTYYGQKEMAAALDYYREALEYSLCEEYHYQIYFWIGNCLSQLGNKPEACINFETFLQTNWEPERFPKWCEFARDYIKKASL